MCLFSLRHEFPSQWAKFQSAAPAPSAELQLKLVPELYPFWSQAIVGGKAPKAVKLTGVEFFAEMLPGSTPATVNVNDKADLTGKGDTLAKNPAMGNLLVGSLSKIALPAAVSDSTHPPLTLYFDNNSMKDLWMALTWGT